MATTRSRSTRWAGRAPPWIVENDLILDPERLPRAPRFKGRVTGVRIEAERIVQIFGAAGAGRDLSPRFKANHYPGRVEPQSRRPDPPRQ